MIFQGTCILYSLDLGSDGKLLPPPELSPRKLLFVGDSITCGEVAGFTPGPMAPTDAFFTNANITYAKLTAKALNAQCSLVSYGGKGIIRDWQGGYKTVNAADYYLPAMLAAGILLSGLQNMAIEIAGEKSDGTLKRLAGSPVPEHDFAAATADFDAP